MAGRSLKQSGEQTFLTRKQKRKQERKEKKHKKMLFFSKKFGHLESEQPSSSKEKVITPKPKKVKNKKPKNKELTYADVRKIQLREANEDEERSIKRLEKILKLNKRKRKTISQSFRADGLDYILEVLEKPEDSQLADFDMNVGDGEINDDLSKALGKGEDTDENLNSAAEHDDSDSDGGYGEGFFEDPGTAKNNFRTNVSVKSVDESIYSDNCSNDSDNSDMTDENDKYYSKGIDNKLNHKKKAQAKNDKQKTDNPKKHSLVNSENLEDSSKNIFKKESMETQKSILKSSSKNSRGSVEQKISQERAVHWDKDNNSSELEDFSSECLVSGEELSELESDADTTPKKNSLKYWEDIYGRLRDKEGNVVNNTSDKALTSSSGKYVPPAKRIMPSSDDARKREIQIRINKQMRGLLNKLNESNMKHITDQIENLYMQHSRNDMNEALVKLIQQSVVLPYLTPEKLVMEHSLMITVLHCNIGSEIGAHCLQCLATAFDSKLKEGGSYGDGKEIDNLLLLLCHLYTFKVTHNLLIFDILKRLSESFNEKDVELILLVLRSVGFALRKDDPLELKNLIIFLQSKASSASHLADQSRIRFMLDTMMAIRNNNMHKIPNYDPSLAEHLRKFLKTLLRKGTYVQELHIHLDDLLKADECGRWWIVGSAWQGSNSNELSSEGKESDQTVPVHQFSEEILELAKKQHMNTEVRKNIFCVLMTAEDYMDAFEKMLRLGLKNQQDRECIHVTLHCCLQEKKWNPYYTYLLEKFCKFDRKYQMALQYALWDRFKEIGKINSFQVTNLAKCLVQLFTNNALPLSVLKTIQLSEMDKTLVKFLRQVLLAILLHESEDVCQNVFLRIAPAQKLHSMREGLRLFMMHFLLRNQTKLESHVASQLKERVDLAVKAMNSANNSQYR